MYRGSECGPDVLHSSYAAVDSADNTETLLWPVDDDDGAALDDA
jgi:hypothetical protein